MPKKRTSLDSLFGADANKNTERTVKSEFSQKEISADMKQSTVKSASDILAESQPKISVKPKSDIVKQTVYLPPAVHEQLRQLAFEERRKMHDYLVEGLDRVFKNRGLKSYVELSNETK